MLGITACQGFALPQAFIADIMDANVHTGQRDSRIGIALDLRRRADLRIQFASIRGADRKAG